MRLASIAIGAVILAAASANAASILLNATHPLIGVPGAVATVTVTLAVGPGGETVSTFSAYGVSIGWNASVARVLGFDGVTTFGKSSQTPIIPGLSGSPTPSCVSAGVNKGKACAVITQANVGAPVFVPSGTVVIGTLLLEVLPESYFLGKLGLSITAYNNNGVTNPAADPNLTIDPSFNIGGWIPEPATGTLLALGLACLGAAHRHEAALARQEEGR